MKKRILSILCILSILILSSCTFQYDSRDDRDDDDDEDDIEETEETETYAYTLYADKTELLVYDIDNLVTFTVSVSDQVDSITLTDEESDTEYEMLDDGAYYEDFGGDDIANDGTYTATIAVDTSDAGKFEFTASVEDGSDDEKTNTITIQVFSPIDQDIIDDMSDVYEDEELLDLADIIKNSTDEDEIEDAKKDIVAYFEDLEEDGIIRNFSGDENSVALSFEFEDGIKGGFILEYSEDSFSPGSTSSLTTLDLPVQPELVAYEVEEENVVGNNRALLLSSFDASESNYTGSYVDAYDTLDLEETYEFAPTLVYNASVINYQSDLDDYGMIFINSHGTFYDGDPIICLDEIVTIDNILSYSLDLLSGRLITLGSISSGKATYAITPAFIEYYYGGGALDNSLVYMCICKGFMNSNLVDAFIASGAGAVTAYTDTVRVSYDRKILGEYLDQLIEGKTVQEAMDAAIDAHGPDDADETPAAFEMSGNEDLTILQMGVINGSFEELSKGWSGQGDARYISRLSDVYPTDLSYMAIISTGLGSGEASYGTEGSSLKQTFIVPDDAETITFDYNVVSEEPMEYVDSEFDDYFMVTIEDTFGNSVQLVYENVNNSLWIELGGSYFSGGDDTTFHTQWRAISYDISAYAGTCITISFHTGDVGDSAYDTAGLIDNIKIYVEK